ncbi:MAG: hypothetical protein R3191_05045, partial [Anaerolineales bacterium]|nr:hypothetical protein [Anaerolineales bacterium]
MITHPHAGDPRCERGTPEPHSLSSPHRITQLALASLLALLLAIALPIHVQASSNGASDPALTGCTRR